MDTGSRIFAIINPAAGRREGRRFDKSGLLEEIRRTQGSSEWVSELEVVFTEKEGRNTAANLFRRAQAEGYNRIVFFGGEGTLNNGLQGVELPCHIPIGIVPTGGANDVAYSCGIPDDVSEAIRIAFAEDENTRLLDLGRVNKRIFVNVVSFGFDAELTKTASRLRQRTNMIGGGVSLGKLTWGELCYWFAGINHGLGLNPKRCPEVYISIGSQKIRKRLAIAAVTNGPRYGGAFYVNPKAKIDDGLLDICLLDSMNFLQAWWVFLKMIKGTHNVLSQVSMHQAREIIIDSLEPLAAEVDGEAIEPEKHYEISVVPDAWKVLVPLSGLVPVRLQGFRATHNQALVGLIESEPA